MSEKTDFPKMLSDKDLSAGPPAGWYLYASIVPHRLWVVPEWAHNAAAGAYIQFGEHLLCEVTGEFLGYLLGMISRYIHQAFLLPDLRVELQQVMNLYGDAITVTGLAPIQMNGSYPVPLPGPLGCKGRGGDVPAVWCVDITPRTMSSPWDMPTKNP